MSEYVPGPILNLAPPRVRDRTRGGGGNGGGKPPKKLTAKEVVKKIPRAELRDMVWMRLSGLADDLEKDATLTRDEVATLLLSVGASLAGAKPEGGWDVDKARSLANAVLTAFEVSGVPPSAVGRRK